MALLATPSPATAIASARATATTATTTTTATAPTLTQVPSFGTNPGALNMYAYLPTTLAAKPPLVLALHGCTQSANDYYTSSGWPKYADLYGFALVFPEQPSGSGLTSKCFDWGDTANDTRGKGQALSVFQMVQYAEAHYNADPSRIYITGLSAGGGMTADLLAAYPDVFAAGSIDSGPPAQCTTAGITDSACTSTNTNSKTPKQWGDLVRAQAPATSAGPYAGPWPRVQIWNGASDYLVKPVALDESRDQWTNVWGIAQTPSSSATLTGNTTENVYNDPSGKPAVETFSIPGMGHGLAVHPGSALDNCGATGAYFLDYICSTYYSMKFFGLDNQSPTPPSLPAPTGLKVTGTTDTSASLSWTAVPNAASYNVYRAGAKTNTTPLTSTTFTDTGLTPGTAYAYTVAAVDPTGATGTRSAPVTATTTGTSTPPPPLPNCYTTDNVSQNLAGRSYFIYGGDSYAIGSNQDMGKYSSTTISSLQQTSPGYWIVVPHC
ncbi:extracellular catalytic domain type 1 short-chain-length polyhydroxyalkanoate depolymerase [Catenulispora yoronensis]|uniref:extracellular catalytic domain type 1 short-chain-length polyhydroxyalkanoate depolymerase n=1 Tax=Catenulispora yoronensis TaxID=450799 RepID=UPI003CD0AE36